MAHFIAVLDADAARRARFMEEAARALTLPSPGLEGLRTGRLERGDFAIAWAAAPRAPVSVREGPEGAGVILGDALDADGTRVLDARPSAEAGRRSCDGFHVMIAFDPAGLTVSADLLGLFPVCWAERDGVVLAGSSAEPFRLHPLFPDEFDEAGAIRLLLAHGPLAGRTLLRGVRRLAPGHVLRRPASGSGVEEPRYTLAEHPAPRGWTYDDHLRRLDEAHAGAVARQLSADAEAGLLLSGGRDSRLLAGYLAETGKRVSALTLGRPSDHDAACALGVARALGFGIECADLPERGFPEWARQQAAWEHLGGAFGNIHMWGALPAMARLPARSVNGYLLEFRQIPLGPSGFDASLSGPYSRGLEPARLRGLLRREWHDELDAGVETMRAAWESGADSPDSRQWRFLLAHGWRAHPGGVLWRFGFASWPVVPVLDRELLETLASVPGEVIADRRAHDDLIRRRFPRLARLPLDRNSHDTMPLEPGRLRRLANPGINFVRALRTRRGGATAERRYYRRLFDIDGPGWRAVRRLAEPNREALTRLFEPDRLSRFLPGPDATIGLDNPVRDAFTHKMLLGLMLWAADHTI